MSFKFRKNIEEEGFKNVAPVEELQESMGQSMMVVSKQSKIKRLAGKMAVELARQHKDPLYSRYVKVRALYLKVKGDMIRRYGMKALQAARSAAMKP